MIVLLAAHSLAVNVAHGWSRIRHDCGVAGHIGTCDVGEEPWGTVVDSCSCHNMFLGPCQLRGRHFNCDPLRVRVRHISGLYEGLDCPSDWFVGVAEEGATPTNQ